MTRWIETDSLSNQNIATVLEIGSYTADADRSIIVQFFADAVAGNGDYTFYATLQINGSGSAYKLEPATVATVATGVTAFGGQSGIINVRSGDIVKVYLDGLAGDTTTPDTTVRWFELAALRPTTADRTLDVTATGAAGIDWANIENPTTAVGLSGTTVKTATDVETDTQDIQARIPAALTANGNIKASLVEILTTALTETAGLIAAGFKKFFNVATPVMTAESVNQTGDAYNVANTRLPGALIDNMINATVSQIGDGAIISGSFDPTAITAIQAGLALTGEAATAAGTLNDLTAQEVRDAMKLAPTAGTPAAGSVDDHLDDIQTDLDNPSQYMANVSGLALAGEAAAALTAYDPPTKTELDSAVSPLATSLEIAALPTAGENADATWDELKANHVVPNSFGDFLDTEVSGVGGGSITESGIADAVWNEAIADHLTAGTTGAKLNTAAAGLGAGAIPWTITATAGGLPVDGAHVQIATDSAFANVIAAGYTTTAGTITFNLDAGTYYVRIQHAGYSWADQSITVV